MTKSAKVLRNSLILLTLGTAASAAWAGSTSTSPIGFNVPVQSAATPPTPRILDLKAPDIHEVMSAEEIAAAIPNPDENELVGPETVQVHGAVPAPYVPGGFAALYWAIVHPVEAWRILTPVQ